MGEEWRFKPDYELAEEELEEAVRDLPDKVAVILLLEESETRIPSTHKRIKALIGIALSLAKEGS